jgi:DNA-binding transcriptional MerR regulator
MLSIGAFARLGEISPRMLRHYDEIGLLSPERVEAGTGYRWYDVAQLARMHRLLALRDLGFSLQQVAELLTDEPSTLLESNEQLEHWIHDSGHTASGLSRELYLQWSEQDPASDITELQAVLIA